MLAISRSVLVALLITLAVFPLAFSMDPEPSDLNLDPTDLDDKMHKVAKDYYFDGLAGKHRLVSADATWFPHQDLAHHQQTVGKNLVKLLHRHALGSKGVFELLSYPSSPPYAKLSEPSTPHSPPGSELGDLRTLSPPPSSEWAEAHNQWIYHDIFGTPKASSSPTYYISIVPPEGHLGKLMNLEPKLVKANAIGKSKVLHQTLTPDQDAKTTSPGKQALALWRYENGQVNLVAIDTWSASASAPAPAPAPHHAFSPGFQKLGDLIPVENINRVVANAVPWYDLPDASRLHL